MAHCNIERTPEGIKVFVEGTKTPSLLYNKILKLVKEEPDFVQARSYWFQDLKDSGEDLSNPENVAALIYGYNTKSEDAKAFMTGSQYVDVNGEPRIGIKDGKAVMYDSKMRTRTVIPMRKEVEEIPVSQVVNTPDKAPTREEEIKPSRMTRLLADSLSKRFGIEVRYTVLGDFKGRFRVKLGGIKYVEINLTNMGADTLFHEFGHPLVLALKEANPSLYNNLMKEYATEEDLVEALGKEAINETWMEKLVIFLRDVLSSAFPSLKFNPNLDSLTYRSTLKDLANVLKYADSVTVPESLEEGDYYQAVSDLKNILNSKKVSDEKYEELFQRLDREITPPDDNDPESKYMIGTTPFERLTNWIGEKFSKPYESPKRKADNLFKGRDINGTIRILNGKVVTYTELVEHFEKLRRVVSEQGRIKHRYIQFLLDKNQERKKLIREELMNRILAWEEVALEVGKIDAKSVDLDVIEDWKPFKYIKKNINYILRQAGVMRWIGDDTAGRDFDPSVEDPFVFSEVKLFSKILGIASTADMVVVHKDNSVSIVDWKTGNLLSDTHWNVILKHAKELGIQDSKLSRAKFEVVLRAVMIKESAPTTKFRGLKIVELHNQKTSIHEADVDLYLKLLSNYLEKADPAALSQLKSAGLMEYTDYIGTSDTVARKQVELAKSASTKEEMINYVMQKLRALGYTQSFEQLKSSPNFGKGKELGEWGGILLDLLKDKGAQLNVDTFDADSFGSLLKNISDISNPVVQTYNKVLNKAQIGLHKDLADLHSKHDKLYKNLIDDAMSRSSAFRAPQAVLNILRGVAAAGTFTNPLLTIGVWGVGKVLAKFDISHEELTGFMRIETATSELLNKGNTYYDKRTESTVALTDAQREYRDFYVIEMTRIWKESMSDLVEQEYGDPITKAELFGLPLELPDGFFPRIPLQDTDRDVEQGLTAMAHSVQRFLKNNVLEYAESDFNDHGFDSDIIPVKYFSHPDDGHGKSDKKVDGHRTYSHDMAMAFKLFTHNQLKKKHMDEAYVVGMATLNVLKFKRTNKANRKLDNLVSFLEKTIMMQTLDQMDKGGFLSKQMTFRVGKYGAALFGVPDDTTLTISTPKLLRLLRGGLSVVVMGFKPLLAITNITLIQGINFSRALSGSIAKRLGNVPPEYANATLSGYFGTLGEYSKYAYAGMLGKADDNKAWILAKKMGWLADANDFEAGADQILNYNSVLSSKSLAFMFSKVTETEGSMYHLISLMKSSKWNYGTTENPRIVSYWDMYDEKGEYKEASRGFVEDAHGFATELKEMDEREIKNLKRISERLQGSYRKEERIALEYTLMGQMLLQFKKYLPTLLKNNLQSSYRDSTQGFYTRQKDEDTYTWQGRMAYGRWRLLFSLLTKPSSLKTSDPEYKQELAHTLTALGLSVGFSLFTRDMFSRDSYLDKRLEYLSQSLSQGLSPLDMSQDVSKGSQVLLFTKTNELVQGLAEVFTDGLLKGERTQAGNIPGMAQVTRNIPWLGAWDQYQRAAADFDKTR